MVEQSRCQIGIFLVVCVVAVLSGSTLYLVAVLDQDNGQTVDEKDIAIIGAGITGSYAAWRLRHTNLTVTLYEYSNRIGGRFHTVQFPDIPDINVELGAMRFRPSEHELMDKAIIALALETKDLLMDYSDTMYYLRGSHLTNQQLANQISYNLKPEHKKSPWQLKWEIFERFTNVNSSLNGYQEVPAIFNHITPDGVPLFQQSTESFYGKYLYPELASYIEDAGGFSSTFQDVSASVSIPAADPSIQTQGTSTKTVVDGFQAIPETMVKQFLETSKRNTFKPNHHLKSIKKLKDGNFDLTFKATETTRGDTKDTIEIISQRCAKTIMLAIPRLALERLDWRALGEGKTENYLKKSLYDAKASKMFFAYDEPWWQNVTNAASNVFSTTPLRVTYSYGVSNSSGKAVLNPSYNDIHTSFWRNALRQGQSVHGLNDDSIHVSDIAQAMTKKYLATIYGIQESDVPNPNYSVMRIWDDYPIGASWYHFRPGYLWNEVAEHMLKPSMGDNVYIISNTFSGTGLQSWAEGGLQIVDGMIKRYFPEYYDF